MFALIDNKQKLIGLSPDEAELESLKAQLKIDGTIEPVNGPGQKKLKVHLKLEKFAGDEQTPETLLETVEFRGGV